MKSEVTLDEVCLAILDKLEELEGGLKQVRADCCHVLGRLQKQIDSNPYRIESSGPANAHLELKCAWCGAPLLEGKCQELSSAKSSSEI
jgi:hypothetical protein